MIEHRFLRRVNAASLVRPYGVVRKVMRSHFEASGPACTIGTLCEVERVRGDARSFALAEVAAAQDGGLVLVPLELGTPIPLGARVFALPDHGLVAVGEGFAGRAVDAVGRPFDGEGEIAADAVVSPSGRVPKALDRITATSRLETGIRSIDGLLTLAQGQRTGIFAAAGVGKTSLVEQLIRQVACDHCIVCLVGERGREIESIWRQLSARRDSLRFTLVAATSDESAALRARSLELALSLAEFWRDKGRHVLLVVDSVTRLAMALREVGLAAGEPPTVRAYTPNVFSALPRIVERCGAVRGGGAISAVMTVLSETDEVDDPIVEVMKSLLDGHIILSRALAERGQFPAIDIARSVSRQSAQLMSPDHASHARATLAMHGTYEEARVMIESGIYESGSNPDIDSAIALRPMLTAFLRQGQHEIARFEATLAGLRELAAQAGAQNG